MFFEPRIWEKGQQIALSPCAVVEGEGYAAALQQAGIALYGGCMGYADTAVEDLLAGNLTYNPNVRCNHHDHHGEGHTCGQPRMIGGGVNFTRQGERGEAGRKLRRLRWFLPASLPQR